MPNFEGNQLTPDQAKAFAEAEKYLPMSFRERAEFQINQECLCMPFSLFLEAVEKTIGRPVFDVELVTNYDGIKREIFDKTYEAV